MQKSDSVAIIGMGCIFPGANGLKEFWRLLFNAEDAITQVPENTHWSLADYFSDDPATPDHTYCSRGGFIPAVTFDPLKFGLPPSNLDATDTSQLLGLLVAEMALEDAGYSLEASFDRQRTNIILGVTGTQELVIPLGARLSHPVWKKALEASGIHPDKSKEIVHRISEAFPKWQENSFPGLLGNVVAGRIANRLNLGGTNSVVDAACASSLSAINTAVMELVSGRCDLSITGGVDSLNDIFMHMCFSKTGVLSHTSDARPFSKNADGTVLGEGVGMLVLKRLEDALKDKDRIYAVIKGIGTSSDGKTGGIYAPDAGGQLRALKSAYSQADIDPSTVECLEAHGTGTRVGDKIEFTALKTLFKSQPLKSTCALGSVKSMIGHTKAAAGAAGIIKAALGLYHKVILPTLKADDPDPELGINDTPFYLPSQARPWNASKDHPRRSGVSAFGFGGSNFHAVLEEHAPVKTHVSWDGTLNIAAFSANVYTDLKSQVSRFQSAVTPKTDLDSREMTALTAWEAGQTRKAFCESNRYRLLITLTNKQDPGALAGQAVDLLEAQPRETAWSRAGIFYGTGPVPGKLGFLFPGQGSQYPDMGKEIISLFPEAMDALDLAGKAFAHEQDNPDQLSLSRCMYPLPGHILDRKTAEAILRRTDVAQPAIGTVSLAMTRILGRFNIRPETVCGHSFGELTALWAAGWMDDATFCDLAAARGRCMALPNDGKEAGTMLAVKAPLADIEKLLADERLDLVLANRNSHDQGVLSGTEAAIEQAAQACRKLKLRAVRLPVAAAFHSHLVGHAAEPFQKSLLGRTITPTHVPVYANTTGHPYPLDPKEIKDLLGNQLLNPVNFVTAMETMAHDGTAVFVEVGPKTVLSGLAGSILKKRSCTVLSMDASGGKKSGLSDLANVLCTLACLGYPVDLTQWEEPCQKPEARKMRIPITGANIRPRQDNFQSAPMRNNETHPDSKPEIRTQTLPPARETQAITSAPFNTDDKQKLSKGYDMISCQQQTSGASALAHGRNTGDQTPASQSQSMIFEAMKMVQKGLDSMSALQAQTAKTHEKFLETQALASQTLQAMMDQTRQMVQKITQPNTARPVCQAILDPVPTASKGASPTGPPPGNGDLAAAASHGSPLLNLLSKQAAPEVHPAPAPEAQLSRKTPEGNGIVSQQTQTLVLETVSRLTGFPVEMLELDMDVESDLGIDSIKRVEIVSELERALPDVTTLTPDALGTLRTLRDICRALGQTDPAEAADKSGTCQGSPCTAKTQVPVSDSAGSGPELLQEIQRLVLETVSRLTGFPVEMLELDMDVESDLGIDSIKRVEIVSELERALPDVTTLTPDTLGTLRTLRDICGALGPVHQSQKSNALPGDDKTIPLAVKPSEAAGSKETMALLVATISDLTGFPMEMLEPDMDLESDLGIDSIKRVEILSRLEQDLPQAGTITPDDMALFRTLGQIAARLETLQTQPAATTPAQVAGPIGASRESDTQTRRSDGQENTKSLLRQVVNLKSHAIDHVRFHNGSRINLPANRRVYITRDGSGMAEAMGRAFSTSGIDASIIDMDQGLTREIHDAGGLVIIADQERVTDCDSGMTFLGSAFAMAKKFAPLLLASASEKGGFLTTVSFLGGTFGFGDITVQNPVQGGLAGLTKTAALEWEAVLCRSLDLPASGTDALGYAEAAAALCMINGPVEMGIRGNQCLIPELVAAPVSHQNATDLDCNDVIVITGGAKGVTARCALELARAGSKAIALLGRSEPPFPEPGWIQSLTSEQEMKKAILNNGFDHRPTPAEVEAAYRKLMSNREISLTLEGIRKAGSRASYFSVDVRDKQQVLETMKTVRKEFNGITGVIHGAGVLEDRLIIDKTLDQWTRVMETKVKGLHALDRATLKDSLKFFVIFSSVAARTGNKGQADYAMANEVLNKTAREMAGQRPECRVVSINWGPWEGGMVNASLKKEFMRQGIDLIPLDEGARSLVEELSGQKAGDTEVVIGASLHKSKKIKPHLAQQSEKKPGLKRAFTTVAGIAACPVLKSHIIAGEPVVPFALMVEWFGHGAEHANPGLVFSGLDDMRLLKGIKPGKGEAGIDVFTGKCRPAKGGFALDSEIRSHFSGSETQFLNTSATVLLKEKLPSPPVHTLPDPNPMKPFSMSVNRAYDTILFHGKDLHGIKAITGYSANGIEVVSARAPLPKAWLASSHRKHWVFDPLVMDSAFQAAILWCSETTGAACLPSYMANLRCYASHNGYTGDVRIILTVNETTERVIKGYFTFLDQTGTVLASITGFEAVRDPSLGLKFKTAAPVEQGPEITPEVFFPREKILAFASGNPSEAFGAPYRIFDRQRKIARLPRPPYFFMDRVIKADAPPWEMKPGGWIEAQFDLPENGWYFRANRSESLPYCILLEVALQPCGWLAAYAGSALKSADRLFFRNLGGDATVIRTVRKDTGTLTMRSRMSRVSEAGGLIIQDFDMEVLDRSGLVYKGTTNFGFFTEKALSKQTGIRNSPLTAHSLSDRDREQAKSLDYSDDHPVTPDDTAEGPNSGMPSKALRMIDRIDCMVPDAGHYGKGFIQGTKHVDPQEWFFHAHFYQDPVCPGSLGIESFLQLLRAFALDRWAYDPDHLYLDLTQGRSHRWMYRGQIVPSNTRILVQAHIRETDDDNHTLAADGTLSVDGLCIYQMENMHLGLVPAHGKVKPKTRGNLKKAPR